MHRVLSDCPCPLSSHCSRPRRRYRLLLVQFVFLQCWAGHLSLSLLLFMCIFGEMSIQLINPFFFKFQRHNPWSLISFIFLVALVKDLTSFCCICLSSVLFKTDCKTSKMYDILIWTIAIVHWKDWVLPHWMLMIGLWRSHLLTPTKICLCSQSGYTGQTPVTPVHTGATWLAVAALCCL